MADEKLLNVQQRQLEKHLDAIVSDVIVADKCYFLLREISASAAGINEHNFGELFGFLQDDLLSMYTLTLARLFEIPKRYRIRGIPATLDFLDANRDAIPFDTRSILTKELAMSGLDALSDCGAHAFRRRRDAEPVAERGGNGALRRARRHPLQAR